MSPDADRAPRRRRQPSHPTGVAGSIARVRDTWRVLAGDQRIAAAGALGLLVSMFLPWYEKSFFVAVSGRLTGASDTVTAFGAFSFVEAAVLLVSAGLLFLLYARAERRGFHLPFGDGAIIMAGGAWVVLLVVIRFFDKPGVDAPGRAAATVGIQWGMFVALAAAGAIAYAGWRIRNAHRPEPPISGWTEEAAALEFEPIRGSSRARRGAAARARRPRRRSHPSTPHGAAAGRPADRADRLVFGADRAPRERPRARGAAGVLHAGVGGAGRAPGLRRRAPEPEAPDPEPGRPRQPRPPAGGDADRLF